MSETVVDNWILLIDVNGNGTIDRQEWEISTATEPKDLSHFRRSADSAPLDPAKRAQIIENFKKVLEEYRVSARDFYRFTDKDGSGRKKKTKISFTGMNKKIDDQK